MDVLAGQRAVDGREGVELVLEQVGVLGVKVASAASATRMQMHQVIDHSHADQLGAVSRNTGPLADDLGREHEVLEDLLVNGGEGAGAGTLLADDGVTRRLAEHATLGKEDDVTVGELLLELTGKSGWAMK